MAKKFLTSLDLLALPNLTTPTSGSVGFGAKSDGLYQKIGAVETKLSVDGHTHPISDITNLQNTLDNKLPLSGGTLTGAVTAPTFIGDLDGSMLRLGDNRSSFTPAMIPARGLIQTFATQGALASQINDSDYSDVIAINSYTDASAGGVNALSFDKSSYRINHFRGNFGASTWLGFKTLAYITDNVASATKLATARTINEVSFDGSKNITITASTTATLTRGSYLTGSNFNGSTATTWAVDATSANTASKVVARDASGNFSAGTITATLSGNASSATKLATARTINGTSFNGSVDITTARWGTTRTIAFSGDVTGSSSINGSADVTTTMTLANSGVTAGTYKSVTVNAKGLVTGGTNPTTLSGYGITDAASLSAFNTHTNNKANPHEVTKTQVGLSQVENLSVAAMFSYANLTEETSIEEAYIDYAYIDSASFPNGFDMYPWKIRVVNSELHFLYNNVLKTKMLPDGSFVAAGGVTAYQ